ncbi:hypothetical protein RA307_31220 [Xanthobacteraceae bacterium Astr-EGSB]|uniref:hypothetical protein n=1 Tax=Astrobacterium formosum TaxID=3069710 RepID=UPI0027B7993F|nr:hypothetical protein [Xanthobacteraceae bacterium Astr-EGSB]
MLSHDLIALRVWLDAIRASGDAAQLLDEAGGALSRQIGDAIEKAEVLERTTVIQATLLTRQALAAPNVITLPAIPRGVPLQGGDLA